MTQTDAYPRNEGQLELVFNLPYYAALYMFKKPLTPSEAARRLRVPANVMHYRVKRLHEAGLLVIADDTGRSRTYRRVAQTFSISPEVLPAVTEALPAMLDTMLSKLHRHALERTEAELRELTTLAQDEPLTFDRSESLTIEKTDSHSYPSWVAISTVDLSAAQYRKIIDAVRQIFDEAEADEGGKRCTLAFPAFQRDRGRCRRISCTSRGYGRLAYGGRLRDFQGWRQCGVSLAGGGPGRRDHHAGGAR